MPRIKSMEIVRSIKAGPNSRILPDGTIENPEPYEAVNIVFENGIFIQVERPLTMAKIRAAYNKRILEQTTSIDGFQTGQDITV